MEPNLDLSRWREVPRGVAYRRWVIVATGLRQLLRLRFFRVLLGLAWMGGTMIATLGFAFSQSVATGGWLESLATRFGPRAEAYVSMLGAFVVIFPDICVHGVFTLIFWAHSYLGLWLSLLALTALVPQLITRDRASHALTVYLSRPLTSVDYLCGKLGIIVCVLVAVWTGPLLFGWGLSMLFATDGDFVVHSFPALLHALLFNAVGLVALAAIALGVSALSRTANSTTAIWMGLWIILGAVAAPPRAPDWLKRASFQRDLGEVRNAVFRLDTALTDAGEKLPLLDQRLATNLLVAGRKTQASDFDGALASLGVFVALSSFVFLRKLRPE
jgi:ABC-2 type transport system permease protein